MEYFVGAEILGLVILGFYLNRQWKRERTPINQVRGGKIRIRIRVVYPP